jgi:hypothetical protein
MRRAPPPHRRAFYLNLEVTGSGGYLQSGSAGLDLPDERQSAGLFSGLTAFTVQGCRPAHMKTARKKPMVANLRSWRVIVMRSKGEYLGSVEASDRERAEAVAVKQFDLDDDQRSRLLIRERV